MISSEPNDKSKRWYQQLEKKRWDSHKEGKENVLQKGGEYVKNGKWPSRISGDENKC